MGLIDGRDAPFSAALHDLAAGMGLPTASANDVFPQASVDALNATLVHRLASIAAPVLLDAFARVSGRSSIRSDTSDDHDRFVAELVAGSLDHLLADHSELARVMRDHAERWCAATKDMIDCVGRDLPLLLDRFGFRGPVVGVEPLANDAFVLRGADTAVVYKTRPVDMDVAWAALIEAIGPELGLAPTPSLQCTDHGYAAYVPDTACTSGGYDETARQLGVIAATATVLGSTDLHRGNLRVSDGDIHLVDAEAVIRIPWDDSDNGADVGASGVVPHVGWVGRCGLACLLGPGATSEWEHLGTDAVRRRPARPTMQALDVEVRDFLRDAPEVLPCFLAGFDAGYAHLSGRADLLSVFDDVRPRAILRPSVRYEETMVASLGPSATADRAHRRAVIDAFVEPPPEPLAEQPARAEKLRPVEFDHIDRLVFPRFTTGVDDTDLDLAGTPIGPIGTTSPRARARVLMTGADRHALLAHTDAIRAAFGAVLR